MFLSIGVMISEGKKLSLSLRSRRTSRWKKRSCDGNLWVQIKLAPVCFCVNLYLEVNRKWALALKPSPSTSYNTLGTDEQQYIYKASIKHINLRSIYFNCISRFQSFKLINFMWFIFVSHSSTINSNCSNGKKRLSYLDVFVVFAAEISKNYLKNDFLDKLKLLSCFHQLVKIKWNQANGVSQINCFLYEIKLFCLF